MRLRRKALAGLAGLFLLVGWGANVWLGGDSPTGAQNAGSGAIATGAARSLQGTAPDGLQAVQTMGLHALPTQCREAGCTVLPYAELKRLFDYYLSTVGELSVEAISAQIRTVLAQNLKPVQLPQAERLLERYLSFKKALVVVEQQFAKTPPGNAVLRERFEAMRVVRARFFSAEEAQAMFGAEDLHDLDALARLAVLLEQHIGAGQGRVPAQRHLRSRGKPADMPGSALLHHKGGFRQVVLGGNLLHQGLVKPAVQAIDHGRVTGEGAVGKGVDLMKIELHE